MSHAPSQFPPDAGQPPAYGARKVAIPRLQRPGQPASSIKERRRVTRACTSCRSHKIKCTGDTPRCKHCETTNRECIYVLPRRDRLKIVTDRCVQLAALLGEIKQRVSDEDSTRIAELLEAVDEDVSDMRQTPAASVADTDADEASTTGAPFVDHHDAHSAEGLDLLDEDLLRNDQARATGYVGKTSEVQWLRSIMLQIERVEAGGDDASVAGSTPSSHATSFIAAARERQGSYAFGAGSIEQVSSFSFYLDSESIDLDLLNEPNDLPSLDVADRLLSCYAATVHTSFPILPNKVLSSFTSYLASLRTGQGHVQSLNPKWQSILNLVFAIGAKYSHLAQASWRADARDHHVYHSRARVAIINEAAVTQPPDVPQIQASGLLAFYYVATGQVYRASVTLGIALRYAYALGLHVRNEDPSAPPSKKEMLVRIWWSLYNLERLTSTITGRPSTIVDICCSVPLPLPLPEEQIDGSVEHERLRAAYHTTPTASPTTNLPPYGTTPADIPRLPTPVVTSNVTDGNSGSFFRATAQLAIIDQNILTALYAAGTKIRSPSDHQQEMTRLAHRMDQWVAALPAQFNFENPHATDPSHYRERMLLGFHFYSSRILLTRPCLGGLSQHIDKNDPFVRRMANLCVDSATRLADCLPNQPNHLVTTRFFEHAPWWCIVHKMMQAICVFLLALLFSVPTSQPPEALAANTKRMIRWLRVMDDRLAERAYQMALGVLQAVASHVELDVSNLWADLAVESVDPTLSGPAWYGYFGREGYQSVPGLFDPRLDGNFEFDDAGATPRPPLW